MRRVSLICFVLLAIAGCRWSSAPHERWAVYYANNLSAETFQPYNLLVFDRDNHPPLTALKEQHKIILGYVSLVEADAARADFPAIKNANLLVDAGVVWRGNPVVDIRRPEWNNYLIEKIIPAVLKQGFDGVMLDTADSAIWLEAHAPQQYAGFEEAMVHTIKNIRARYPHIKIMLNRGFEMLPRVGADIDMVLAENIYSSGHPDFTHYLHVLNAAKTQSPTLKVYTLDYRAVNDTASIKDAYAVQRSHGFIPYVATPELNQLIAEPK